LCLPHPATGNPGAPAALPQTRGPTSSALPAPACPRASFSLDEIQRLWWLRATIVAERYLAAGGQPCRDHTLCCRLAFALWLQITGRLSEQETSRSDR